MTGALIVMALSMVGFPPTGGFFGKWYIILGALEAHHYFAVAAVILSHPFHAGVFCQTLERIFRDRPGFRRDESGRGPLSLKVSVGTVSAAIILLGVWSDPIVGFLLKTAVPTGW